MDTNIVGYMARPRKDKVKLQTWISPELNDVLESHVKRSGLSKTDIIEKLLRIGIDTEQQKSIQLYNSDAFEVLPTIEEKSISLIILDLPYEVTACNWDIKIDLSALWTHLERVLTDNGTVIMFGAGIFNAELILSNPKIYKYSATWVKNRSTSHIHSKNKLMPQSEQIHIFSKGAIVHRSLSPEYRMTFNLVSIVEKEVPTVRKKCNGSQVNFESRASHSDVLQTHTNFPTDILYYDVPVGNERIHPTQKPVDLLEFLIKTYSNEDDMIADFFMGSGSTAIASNKCGRKFIGSELNKTIFQTAKQRIEHVTGFSC